MLKRSSVRAMPFETVLLALFLACGPFVRGFIFENELMIGAAAGSIGYLVCIMRGRAMHDRLLYVLLALTVIYGAGIGYGADHREALTAFVRTALLIPVYVFALSVPRIAMERIWTLFVTLTALSVPLSIVTGRIVDGRLAGFIDYANAYAILLLLALLLAFALSLGEQTFPYARWLQLAIFFCAGGLYLTESRTVLALTSAAFVFLYAWSRRNNFPLWLRSFTNAMLGIAAGAAYEWSPWLAIPAAVVCALGYYASDALLSKRAARFALTIIAPMLGIAAAAVGSGMASRWSTALLRTGEGFTRLVYYGDAWSMFLDSPIWGFGAGAWSAMQYRYQSASYFTAYVHSQPLQVMMETGLIGLTLFAAACAVLMVRGILAAKRKGGREGLFDRVLLLAMGTLLLHGLTDFSLSFPYLLGLLLVLGAAVGSEPSGAAAPVPRRRTLLKVSAGLLASATLAVSVMLFVSDRFQAAAEHAIAENRKADAVRQLDRSAAWAIVPDRVQDRKARLYLAEYEAGKDARYLEVARGENTKALSEQPDQMWYRKLRSDIAWLEGDKDASLRELRDLTEQNRFMTRWREELKEKEAEQYENR
ncbi:O-antigen ligase family protein [Paenibacillus sacheonensis]|uniref:O-antigen ligase-related domain-containing protein n=1 Tax=Paenibacillus sacheonensis TaxID=742054 RepID=A0A7X4YSW0_9BACL|nr:O-antigen ligase family protein [Paenibacillus sacheonensis]MBM7567786.1 O-antigen ligase [Paenibacillus sacheonensis]NBC71945.1 hypothetical protein [Paenibacillus sacheonensis]